MEAQQFVLSHAVVLILAAAVPALTRALREDVVWFKTASSPIRLLLLTLLAGCGTAIDQVQNGVDWKNALVAALVVGGPSMVIELMHILFGGGDAGSGPTAITGDDAPATKPSSSSSVKLVALVIAAMALSCVGGPQKRIDDIKSVVTDVATYVQDAQQVLNIAQAAVSLFFMSHPTSDTQAKINGAFADVHLALDTAIRATKGVTDMTNEKFDDAWGDFKTSWRDLGLLLREIGVVTPAGMFSSRRGEVRIPEPMAITRGK